MRISSIGLIIIVAACWSCSSDDTPAEDTQEQTQRARDSAIAESRLPGARGVGGALEVADSAAARQARIDSASKG